MPFSKDILTGASGNQGSAGFYEYQIEHSLYMSDVNAEYLQSPTWSAGADKKYTVSAWLKIANKAGNQYRMFTGDAPGNIGIGLNTSDNFHVGSHTTLTSTAVFRDQTAWTHFVVQNGPSSGNGALYVNGVQQTLSSNAFNSNSGLFRDGGVVLVGVGNPSYDYDFVGYIAEFYGFYDMTVNHTDLGEFKNDVWVPKEYTGTYTSQSFYLKFGDSSNLGLDSSGNGNNFSNNGNAMGADHQVLDSPTFGS